MESKYRFAVDDRLAAERKANAAEEDAKKSNAAAAAAEKKFAVAHRLATDLNRELRTFNANDALKKAMPPPAPAPEPAPEPAPATLADLAKTVARLQAEHENRFKKLEAEHENRFKKLEVERSEDKKAFEELKDENRELRSRIVDLESRIVDLELRVSGSDQIVFGSMALYFVERYEEAKGTGAEPDVSDEMYNAAMKVRDARHVIAHPEHAPTPWINHYTRPLLLAIAKRKNGALRLVMDEFLKIHQKMNPLPYRARKQDDTDQK